MSIEHIDIAILGSGIAGLGAAKRARELNRDAVIFESKGSTGGLLDNFLIRGFRFDNAVHLSFGTETEVLALIDQTQYFTHSSDAYCYDSPYRLKHPVQNNLYPLPAKDKARLIKSFVERPNLSNIENYNDWLRNQYGDIIAERFPIRYTKKYWGVDATALSTTWIGDRMRRADLEEVLFGAFTADTPNTYYTKEMRYPVIGGFKSFIEPLIAQSNIRLLHEAKRIDTKNNTILFEHGEKIHYNKLISTIPLPNLVQLVDEVPTAVLDASHNLKATSIDLISIGFNKPVIDDLWFYIYDDDILASRAYSPSKKSPSNAPEGCSSLQFEIYNYDIAPQHKREDLIGNCEHALKKLKIATMDDVLFFDHRRIPFGNIIFTTNMENSRDIVRRFVNEAKISACGRFGEWDYLWSHQSFLSGLRAL